MSTLGIEIHYGFTLTGTGAQLTYRVAATSTDYQIPIPPGQYFFKHDTASKDIRSVVAGLIDTALGGGSSFALTTHNDRQLEWTMDAATDYINIVNNGDGDDLKLAEAMGLYDNTGDLTYFRTNNITNGYITPNALSSWFATGGRTYDTHSLLGFDVTDAEIYRTEGGSHSAASGSVRHAIGPVRFTGIEGDALRGGWPYATQAVAGTTINATWTTSIWRAGWLEYNDPVFYLELGATPEKYEMALREPIKEGSAVHVKPGWTQNLDLTMQLDRLGDPL